MKKIISIILSLIMILGLNLNLNVFAADSSKIQLTEEQQAARTTFMNTYNSQWQILVDLRTQTEVAFALNKAVRQQISETEKNNSTSSVNNDLLIQIKDTIQKNKDLSAQAKTLNEKRKDSVTKWRAAVKAKDTAAMKSLSDETKGLNDQIETIRT